MFGQKQLMDVVQRQQSGFKLKRDGVTEYFHMKLELYAYKEHLLKKDGVVSLCLVLDLTLSFVQFAFDIFRSFLII